MSVVLGRLTVELTIRPDGVTMLPTFMPVATQGAIKGLTPQQVESLGVTLILNNTYHLNLRPGTSILDNAGGAHKFQGWRRNMLTVRVSSTCALSSAQGQPSIRIAGVSSLYPSATSPQLQKKEPYSQVHLRANPPCSLYVWVFSFEKL